MAIVYGAIVEPFFSLQNRAATVGGCFHIHPPKLKAVVSVHLILNPLINFFQTLLNHMTDFFTVIQLQMQQTS